MTVLTVRERDRLPMEGQDGGSGTNMPPRSLD
jgi:hypothetical protein